MKKNLILALVFILSLKVNAKNHLENRLFDLYSENAYNITRNILSAIPTHELQFIANLFAQSLVSVCFFASIYPVYKEFKKVIQALKQKKKTDYISLLKKITTRMIAMVLLHPVSTGISMHYADLIPHNR